MPDEQLPEGVTIKYQDKLCGTVFDYTRPTGLEPGSGTVFVSLDEFKEYRIDESISGVDSAPIAGVTQEKKGTNKRGFQSSGDLVFAEVVVDGAGGRQEHVVTIKNVLLTERGVQSAFAFDDENDLCRLEITDIRELWKTRGLVMAWVNVPKNGVGLPASSGGGSGGTQERQAVASTLKATGATGDSFIPGSMDAGKPRTLKAVLTKIVLPALPGNPTLNRMPKDLEDELPIGHIWNGELPKKCLRDLLDEFQLTLSLDLDSNVSLWKRGEGPGNDRVKLASGAGKPDGGYDVTIDTNSASCDPRVASAKKLVNYKWIPTTVVVLGPPIIVTERLKLEPVGEINGTVLPLVDALQAIGLTMDKAQRFALTRATDRTGLPSGVTLQGIREFDRWAFKYFRIPGGAEANADKLPILNARGSVTKAGELHPVKVFSESHTIVNIMGLKLAALAAKAAQANIKSGAALGVGREQQKAATEAAMELLKKADPQGYLVTHNIAFAEQASGWELDAARGIVKFHSPQGLCVADGVDLDTYKALIAPSAAVELEFAHTLKPGANDDVSLGFRYFSVWTRGAGGKASPADQIPPGSAPLVVERQELQGIHGLNGETNKATLDNFARKVADSVFGVPQSELGAVVTFGRPVPATNTGQALSVRWFTEDERPRVEVHVNSFGPFHPDSDLRTRAFGLPIGRGRELESPIVPRGVR